MTEPSAEVLGYWGHSFEEDEPDTTVYRPADHAFPPARARDGLELRADGTAVAWRTGRGDAQEPVEGSWVPEGSGRIRLSFPGAADRVLQVLEAGGGVLRVHEEPPAAGG